MSNTTPVQAEAPAAAVCPPAARGRHTIMSAVAASVAMWVIAVPVGGVQLAVRTGTGVLEINPIMVAVASAVASAVAVGLLAFLRRRTARARTIWTALVVGGTLVSLVGPLGAVSLPAMNVLMTMHVAVGAIVLVTGRRMCRPERV